MSFWCHFGDILVSFRCHFEWSDSKLLVKDSEIIRPSFWCHFGVILMSFWCHLTEKNDAICRLFWGRELKLMRFRWFIEATTPFFAVYFLANSPESYRYRKLIIKVGAPTWSAVNQWQSFGCVLDFVSFSWTEIDRIEFHLITEQFRKQLPLLNV